MEIESNNNLGIDSKENTNNFRENINAENALKIRVNKTDYRTENNITIYDLYKKYNVISNDSLDSNIFYKISKEFFNFIKSKWIDEFANSKEKSMGTRFLLIILPSSKKIHYMPKTVDEDNDQDKIVDSFGNETSGFPKDATQTAKFLSFDDPAFSLNCRTKNEFYQNLSIGKNSFKTINIPNESVFNISGLSWIFTDLDDPSYKFEQAKKGIYHQLLSNYLKLKQKVGDSYQKQSCIKIICFEKNQAKLEILFDDNLTMQSMRKIFQRFNNIDIFQSNIPRNALEILIDKGSGTKIIWSMYINAIQSLLHEKKINRNLILSFFIKKIRAKIFEWITRPKNNFEIIEFFDKSEFCIKILTTSDLDITIMNPNEEYAYKLGLIAGRYVTFKKNADEQSNSLKDILTYSKYDREKLRFVFHRIGIGINISNSNESNMKNMLDYIKQNHPSNEISDDDANKDYSYFFYKGVFRELC